MYYGYGTTTSTAVALTFLNSASVCARQQTISQHEFSRIDTVYCSNGKTGSKKNYIKSSSVHMSKTLLSQSQWSHSWNHYYIKPISHSWNHYYIKPASCISILFIEHFTCRILTIQSTKMYQNETVHTKGEGTCAIFSMTKLKITIFLSNSLLTFTWERDFLWSKSRNLNGNTTSSSLNQELA